MVDSITSPSSSWTKGNRPLSFKFCQRSFVGAQGITAIAHAQDVREAIAQQSRAFEQCYVEKDAKCLVEAYYVRDDQHPVVFPPGGGSPVRGRAALEAYFEKEFEGVDRIRLETVDVFVEGDTAQETGRAHLALRTGDNAVGRYVVLWVRGDDGWRVKLDLVASD